MQCAKPVTTGLSEPCRRRAKRKRDFLFRVDAQGEEAKRLNTSLEKGFTEQDSNNPKFHRKRVIYVSIYQPRPYQSQCIATLAEARKNDVRKGLIVMASGLGKTLTAIFDIQQFLREHPDARILVLCHQESILLQSKAKFCKVFGEEYSYGMYTGSYKVSRRVDFTFATFQTMYNAKSDFAPEVFDYIIVDEAHHTLARTYRPTVDYFQPKFLLGLTATKDRMDGQDILDIYDQILYQMDIYDGWIEEWLARVDYRIMLDDLNEAEFRKYVSPQVKGAKVSLSELNKTLFAPQHDRDIVASINEQLADLDNPSMFVFCPTIEHADAMARQFGDKAAVIHSGQSAELNESVLSKFRVGDLRILISVNMLNEGIDVPETDAVIFLRATESSTIYLQQLGRGLRLSDKKRAVRVLDYVANLERIATILTMEETAKKRIATIPSDSITDKPDPIIVNIPATKFKVKRVDIERLLRKTQSWTTEEIIEAYFQACLQASVWLSTIEFERNKNLPGSLVTMKKRGIENIRELRRIVRERHPEEADVFDKLSNGGVIPTEILVRRYYDESVEAGHWLTRKEVYHNPTLPSMTLYTNRLGGIVETRRLAAEWFGEFQVITIPTSKKSDEQLLQEYHDASKEAGRWLSDGEILQCTNLASVETYRNRFGGIKRMRQRAIDLYGDPFNGDFLNASVIGLSREQIIRAYHEESQKAGRWLRTTDFKDNQYLPSYALAGQMVGGIEELKCAARELCGIPEFEIQDAKRQEMEIVAKKDKLIRDYVDASRKIGRYLTSSEIDQCSDLASGTTYRKYFEAIPKMRQEAIAKYGDFTKENN